MKRFISENFKVIKKLLIYQFGAAFFGILVNSSAGRLPWLNWLTGILAILFYVYLLYSAVWEEGARDRIRVDGGRMTRDDFKGLKIALVANIPNIIIGVVMAASTIVNVLASAQWAGNVAAIANAVGVLWEGMYVGIITAIFPQFDYVANTAIVLSSTQIILRSVTFILIVLPALSSCHVAYKLGYNGVAIIKTSAKNDNK